MNSNEAAIILTILGDRYEGSTHLDGFSNSLLTNDFEATKLAVESWCARMEHYPLTAELNAEIRQVQGKPAADRYQRPEPPPHVINGNAAAAAFSAGYRQARREAGDEPEEIERKLTGQLHRFKLPVIREETRAE